MVDDTSVSWETALNSEDDEVGIVVISVLFRRDCVTVGRREIITKNSGSHCLYGIFVGRVVFNESDELVKDWYGEIYCHCGFQEGSNVRYVKCVLRNNDFFFFQEKFFVVLVS